MSDGYDCLVIGAGSGGLAMARTAADLGARCAIVEAQDLGGTCVNRGCVPKKLTWYAADLVRHYQTAGGFGLTLGGLSFDWQRLARRRQQHIRSIHDSYRDALAEAGVELIQGWAEFVARREVAAAGRRLRAEHIVIANGGRPRRLSIPGAEHAITSDDFFDLGRLPDQVVVIGGGYISVELANMLQLLGSDVTLLVRGNRVLKRFDTLLQDHALASLRQTGVTVMLETEARAIAQRRDNATTSLSLELSNDDTLNSDTVIMAVGRQANSDRLGLDDAGIELDIDDSGKIPTDAEQNTRLDGIYAVGDVTNQPDLTPVAVASGERLARRLFGSSGASTEPEHWIPTVVFGHPPLGAVGLTESAARERYGDDVTVYQNRFTPLREQLVEDDDDVVTGAVKLVCAGSEQTVVGCHAAGPGTDEILQGFAVAVKAGIGHDALAHSVAIHPTNAEELLDP